MAAEPYVHVGIHFHPPGERRDPNEPLDWDEGWDALTTLWTVPCFTAYGERQPLERRMNYTPRDFTQAYTICWDMSTQRSPFNWAEDLYRGYQRTVTDFVRQHITAGMEQSASDDRILILELVARWYQHKILIKDYSRAYVILDRYFVKHNGLTNLQQTGWQIFWKIGCTPMVRQRIMDALVHLSTQGTDYTGEGEGPGAGPTSTDLGGALAGCGLTCLSEVAPDVAEQVRIRLRGDHGLDAIRIKDYGKTAGLQAKMLDRPFPGVLPLGPSQVSFFYRYHIQKMRVLSERGEDEGEGAAAEGQQQQQQQQEVGEEEGMAVAVEEEEGQQGTTQAMESDDDENSMVIGLAAAQPQTGEEEGAGIIQAAAGEGGEAEGGGQGPCRVEVMDLISFTGRVLQEAVFTMGDDMFRELLDHLHTI